MDDKLSSMEARHKYELQLTDDIFSNQLITDEIWKYLNVHDLLQASLVSKLFCSLSRKFLRNSQYCSIQLSKNPCRALQLVNTLLETSVDVCYNGIRHKRRLVDDDGQTKWYLPYNCDDSCLSNQLGESVDVRQLYFKSTRKNRIQANEITELRACGGMLTVDCHKPWWLIFGNFYPFNQPLWFPTLKILKIPWNRDIATKLISSAPKLEEITGCLRGSWSFEQMGMKGKEYAMTNRTVNGMNEIQVLTTTIKPKLEKVILKPQPTEEEYHCVENNLYMFSHMICRYLRRLDCTISTLYLLANGPGMPQFPNLKTLRLCNDLDMIFQESVSSLRSVEFERSFPNVEKVALSSYHEAGPPTVRTFCPPKQDFQSYSVTMLTISFKFLEQQPIVISNVFPNVKVLRLSTTSSNSSLSLLPHVLVINPEWKDLEKIDLLHGNSVEDLQLDSIFRYICDRRLSNDKGTGNHLHKLNTLSIYCKPQDGTYYSHLINANSYLISKDIAELIATKLHGFTIEFKVVLKYQFPRMDYLLGLNFDHIRPYAKIRKTIVNGGDFSKHTLHIWSFEF